MLFCVSVFAGEQPKASRAKTVMLSGKISDIKNNETLAGVKIVCNACTKTVYSDFDGNFFLVLEVNPDEDVKVEFSQAGYRSKTLDIKEVQSKGPGLEINLEAY